MQVGTKSRVFKVLKTPVPLDDLPEPLHVAGLRVLRGVAGRPPRPRVPPQPRSGGALEVLRQGRRPRAGHRPAARGAGPRRIDRQGQRPAPGSTVYLAESTSDVAVYRDNVERELERRGHRVLPQRAVPLAVEELTAAVTRTWPARRCRSTSSAPATAPDPKNEDRSIPHVQIDLAGALAARGGLTQLIWIPEALETIDEAQASLVAGLQTADIGSRRRDRAGSARGVQGVRPRSAAPSPSPPPRAPAVDPRGRRRVYLVHDRATARPSARCRTSSSAAGTW